MKRDHLRQLRAMDMLATDSAVRAERDTNALQRFDGPLAMKKQQVLENNLDEMRRVTDTKYIATTESLLDGLSWDTAALCVAGDGEQSNLTKQDSSQHKNGAADLDPYFYSEDDCFEIDEERIGPHYVVHGTLEQLEYSKLHNQGGNPCDGILSSLVVTSFDRRAYRAWIGSKNLHVL